MLSKILLLFAIAGLDGIDDVPDINFPIFQWDLGLIKIDILYPFEVFVNFLADSLFDLVKMPINAFRDLFLTLNSWLQNAGLGAPAIYISIFIVFAIIFAIIFSIVKILIP